VEDGTSIGALLGVLPAWSGEPQTWPFEAGDVLLLYSDGLSEARNKDKVMFNVRLRDEFAGHAAKPVEEILEALFQAVRAWGEPADDLTIVVCRRSSEARIHAAVDIRATDGPDTVSK
jgi:serine phosphatase RsbU (regulator of sigma subunit)